MVKAFNSSMNTDEEYSSMSQDLLSNQQKLFEKLQSQKMTEQEFMGNGMNVNNMKTAPRNTHSKAQKRTTHKRDKNNKMFFSINPNFNDISSANQEDGRTGANPLFSSGIYGSNDGGGGQSFGRQKGASMARGNIEPK
jgi:hypothetical protein